MDDSPVQETKNVSMSNSDEIDPLDAYMLEIDNQVQKLDENDKLKEFQNEPLKQKLSLGNNASEESIKVELEDEEEEEIIGKAGNFSTVEELIA